MIWLKTSFLFQWNIDRLLSWLLGALAAICGTVLLLIILFLAKEAAPLLSTTGWTLFFASDGWYPLENRFGLLPMLWASIAIMLGAIVLATPVGMAVGIFDVFYAGTASRRVYRLIIGLLAGIPSVIIGLWGLTRLVPVIANLQPPGTSLVAAIIVLAIMILPTVAVTASAALASVPASLMAGAAALGMSRKSQIVSIAIPAARSGIISGILLAMARALGETMAVLMVAGNVVQNPTGLFEPVRALTANIALEMAYATGTHRASLFASGLLLTVLILLLAWLAIKTRGAVHHD